MIYFFKSSRKSDRLHHPVTVCATNERRAFALAASGSCYIIKVSAKTNKEYKQYLKSDVSQDICKKLGKEYKAKKK